MMTVRRHTGSGGECLARTAATERPFRRGMDGTPDAVDAAHSGGYGCVSRLAAVTHGDRLRKKTFIVCGGAEKGSRIVAAWPSGQWAGAGYLADDPAEL